MKKHGRDALRLRAAGYLGKRDEEYLAGVRRRVTELGLDDLFDYAGELSREAKVELLRDADVVSIPTIYRDPKGLSVLEALANGTPVVQPAHGSFPEMIEATGGGLLSEPGSVESLAGQIDTLLGDHDLRQRLGAAGAAAVHERFSEATMAEATLDVYRQWVNEPTTAAITT